MWTRRAFLKSGSLAVLATGLGGCPLFLNRTALATPSGPFRRPKVLVALFQRGAMDGLMAVPPLHDPHLARHRPTLRLATKGEGAMLDLNGTFGLHPSLAPLKPFFDDGRLAIVHGVGSPNTTRSHFDAQDYMETGTPGRKGTRSGWLNRAVGQMGHDATPFQAVALTRALPRALYGPASALAVADLKDFALSGTGAMTQPGTSLEALYEQTTQELLHDTSQDSFEAMDVLEQLRKQPYRPAAGAAYPRSPLGNSLRQVAQLIKAGVGLEVAFVESFGWDTHVNQGTTTGAFARRTGDLAQCIAAFWTDLDAYQDDVVLMTMTEFGRTVRENGSRGTDHGRASCLFTLGHHVAGGQVYGSIPELDPDALEDRRDLPVTTDFRAVFAGVAGPHLGLTDDATLFPDWEGQRLDLIRG